MEHQQEHLKGIVEGKVPSCHRHIAQYGGMKATEKLKATAMGQAIHKYSDDEVLISNMT